MPIMCNVNFNKGLISGDGMFFIFMMLLSKYIINPIISQLQFL